MKSKDAKPEEHILNSQRLDIWLWASRFYKTRKIATDAVKGGHVWINNKRSKPSRLVKINDELRIKRFPYEYTVTITALSSKRLSASLAKQLFHETEPSRIKRLEKERLLKNQRAGVRYDRRRPDKRDRNKMLGIKRQNPEFE